MMNSVLCYLEETAKRLPDKVAFLTWNMKLHLWACGNGRSIWLLPFSPDCLADVIRF